MALVWSRGLPVSPCRKSGSGINRPSSEREGEKEGRGRGRKDRKGRKRRGWRGEREAEILLSLRETDKETEEKRRQKREPLGR